MSTPDAAPHPLVEQTLRSMRLERKVYSFVPGGLEKVVGQLVAITDIDELWAAGRQLVQLACYLDTELKSPVAAKALLRSIEVLQPRLAEHVKQVRLDNAAGKVARREQFERFSGLPPAPKEAPSEGSEHRVPAWKLARGSVRG